LSRTTDTGKKLDTAIVTQSDSTAVHRESVFIADAGEYDARAPVEKQGLGFALTITEARISLMQDLLENILRELKIVNVHLQEGSDEEIHERDKL